MLHRSTAAMALAAVAISILPAAAQEMTREEELAGFYIAVGAASPPSNHACFERVFGPLDDSSVATYTTTCDDYDFSSDCTVKLGRSAAKDTIFVSFRGSWFWQVFVEILEGAILVPMDKHGSDAKVSKYFYHSFNSLWDNTSFGADFDALVSDFPTDKIVISGHSLGASLAAVMAATLSGRAPSGPILLHQYGPPRTGDHEFVKLVNGVVHAAIQVIHSVDCVPAFPSVADGFERVKGIKLYTTANMNSTAPSLWCEKDSDKPCMTCNGARFYDFFCYDCGLHLSYYELKDVAGYGESGCPHALG